MENLENITNKSQSVDDGMLIGIKAIAERLEALVESQNRLCENIIKLLERPPVVVQSGGTRLGWTAPRSDEPC